LQSSLKPDDKYNTGEFDSQWKELLGDKANPDDGLEDSAMAKTANTQSQEFKMTFR
jgi:hypothetical protein